MAASQGAGPHTALRELIEEFSANSRWDRAQALKQAKREDAIGYTASANTWMDAARRLEEAASALGVSPQPERHRCCGCGHRWESPSKGAELCGDCWRRGQSAIFGAGVSPQTDRPEIKKVAAAPLSPDAPLDEAAIARSVVTELTNQAAVLTQQIEARDGRTDE